MLNISPALQNVFYAPTFGLWLWSSVDY